MELLTWNLIAVLFKCLIYFGVAASIGSNFIGLMVAENKPLKAKVNDHSIFLLVTSLIATVFNFFIQIGNFSESGFFGMFDMTIGYVLWSSEIGDVTIIRCLGLLVALSFCFYHRVILLNRFDDGNSNEVRVISTLLYLSSTILLAGSFILLGHISELSGIRHR